MGVDLSASGAGAAREAAGIRGGAGLTYIDAPVSGGQAGARAATITVMWAGPGEELERHRDVLLSFCKNPFHVGAAPGQGQALKIINNFLSGTAMAATSEAVLYGLAQGLAMATMLAVIHVPTCAHPAARAKLPNRTPPRPFHAAATAPCGPMSTIAPSPESTIE